MIIVLECKSCLKKFKVNDGDIPDKGRIVQCGNCSSQWLQMPITPSVPAMDSHDDDVDSVPSKISSSVTTEDLEVDNISPAVSKNEFKASDGKNYKFLGNQWAQILPSGKTGKLARKKISKELNSLSGRKKDTEDKTIKKTKQSENQYQETEGGMSIFSFLIILVISFAAVILLLDTFKNQLIPFIPNLDNYLIYIFETLNNIYIIIKDLFNNYK